MSSEQEKKEEDKKKELSNYITTRLYGLPYVNNQGYKIGNYVITINKDKLPFSSTDQVDHFLLNLFDYVKNVGLPADKQVPVDDFFKNNKDFFSFMPIKYLTDEEKKQNEEEKVKFEKENDEKRKSVFEQAAAVARDRAKTKKNKEKDDKPEDVGEGYDNFGGEKKRRKNKRKTKTKKSKKRRTRKSRK